MKMIVAPIVSDLFFNHEHPTYDKLSFKDCTIGDMLEAIKVDAKEFVEAYGSVIKFCPTAEDLALDFMDRL